MKRNEKKEIINSIKQMIELECLGGINEIIIPPGRGKKVSAGPGPGGELFKAGKKVSKCEKCKLSGTRLNVVFGEGCPSAKLMFVGEAPGADEDRQGRPFVGKAGQLLTKIIESIGLKREEVYICNILKCRPPENRNPLPDEISACLPYLEKQIEIIKPAVICALGKFAAQTLLRSEVSISALRGRFHDFNGIRLMPTYHPAYLLRNASGKKDVWDDMQVIAGALNLKIPDHKADKKRMKPAA
ncbi:MAG: uracil-DNA glycosylase [Candidatus Omnitrophota bacterium]